MATVFRICLFCYAGENIMLKKQKNSCTDGCYWST